MFLVQPAIAGHLIVMLSTATRMTVSQAHKAIEVLGSVQVDESTPSAIHELLAQVEGTEAYAYIPSVLSSLTGVDTKSLTKAASILQNHLTSPDYISDDLMRQMNRTVYALFDEVSPVGLMAQAVANLLDALVSAGRYQASHIDPLLGFYIPPFLYQIHRRLADEPGSTYRATFFSLDHDDKLDRLREILFHLSYMVDTPAGTLERGVDRVMTRLEDRKPIPESELLAFVGIKAA